MSNTINKPNMDCKAAEKKLVFLYDNSLPSIEKEAIGAHLAQCATCTALYASLSRAFEIIAEEKQSALNPYFIQKTVNKANERYGVFSGKAIPASRGALLRPALSYTLVLFTGLLLGFIIGGWFQTDSTTTENPNDVVTEIFNTADTDLLTLK